MRINTVIIQYFLLSILLLFLFIKAYLILFSLVKDEGRPNNVNVKMTEVGGRGQKQPQNGSSSLSSEQAHFSLESPKSSTTTTSSDKGEKWLKRTISQSLSFISSSWALVKHRLLRFDQTVREKRNSVSTRATLFAGTSGGELLESFVFGSVRSLEKNTLNNLKALGMLHVASASGANVAVVVKLIELFTAPIKRPKLRYLLLLIGIGWYAQLADFSASIVRASLSASYQLWGELWHGRPTHPLLALGWAASVMVLLKPDYLTSLSYQLSCLATLSLGLFSARGSATTQFTSRETWFDGPQPQAASQPYVWDYLNRVIKRSSVIVSQTLSDSFNTSLAAAILITPFLWIKFGDWSSLSLIANTLLLWLTPLITQVSLALVVTTAWAGEWPLDVYWQVQRILGITLNLLAKVFLLGATRLSQIDPWIRAHAWFRYSSIGWWLLSGYVVVKQVRISRRATDDSV
jgi:ComEC/Rec2-related protein